MAGFPMSYNRFHTIGTHERTWEGQITKTGEDSQNIFQESERKWGKNTPVGTLRDDPQPPSSLSAATASFRDSCGTSEARYCPELSGLQLLTESKGIKPHPIELRRHLPMSRIMVRPPLFRFCPPTDLYGQCKRNFEHQKKYPNKFALPSGKETLLQ